MALTMTRTRTQTTLTRLATQLARINGELDTLGAASINGAALSEGPCPDQTLRLLRQRDALRLVLIQFDADISLDSIK